MPEQIETTPERYVRINITKNSKGYSHETTVSLRWSEGADESAAVGALLRLADGEARAEIARRERIDADGVAA